MTPPELLQRIEKLFQEQGSAEYHGEAVTQLEHALQAATLAERDGRSASWIVAALLHDIGHLLQAYGESCADRGIDDQHELLGVRFLARAFAPDITEPIRLHVAAKRYLCQSRPKYASQLSPASLRSLELQGGPMTEAEAQAFESNPYFEAALAIREYDDQAKIVGGQTPPFTHFRPYLETALRGQTD